MVPPTSIPEVQGGKADEWGRGKGGWSLILEGSKLVAHPVVGDGMLAPAPLRLHLTRFLGWPVAQDQLGHRCLKADQEPLPPHHGARSLSIMASGKEGDVRVKYSSSPLGEGKGGSRYIIFRELYYPLQWGHGLEMPGPLDLGGNGAGLGLEWGEWEERPS